MDDRFPLIGFNNIYDKKNKTCCLYGNFIVILNMYFSAKKEIEYHVWKENFKK